MADKSNNERVVDIASWIVAEIKDSNLSTDELFKKLEKAVAKKAKDEGLSWAEYRGKWYIYTQQAATG